MENRNKLFLFGTITVVAIIIAGLIFLRGASERADQNGENNGNVENMQNNLTVRGQLPGDKVVVESVSVADRGFIVIHEEGEDGNAGTVIGFSDLIGGELTNVEVPIGVPMLGGETLYVMLHSDADNDGEFILENDPPVTGADGELIMISVKVAGEAPQPSSPFENTEKQDPDESPVDEGVVESTSTIEQ